jgi:hypothetical protein
MLVTVGGIIFTIIYGVLELLTLFVMHISCCQYLGGGGLCMFK